MASFRGLWLQMGLDTGFRQRGRTGCTVRELLHSECQIGPFAGVAAHGTLLVAAGRGRKSHLPFSGNIKVFTEALEEAGYDVAFTGKGWAPGDPGVKDGRRRQLTGKAWQNRKLTPPTPEILATDYAANFSDFLSSREDASRPWFFWFGCREPHRRYEYGSGVAKGGRTTGEIDRVPAFWPDNETVRNDMLDYGSRSNTMTANWD